MAWDLKPCGTVTAYVRHKRHGEQPCQECRDAKRDYSRAKARERREEVERARVALAVARVTTLRELETLPSGSVLVADRGPAVQRHPSGVWLRVGDRRPHSGLAVLALGPLRLVHRPVEVVS